MLINTTVSSYQPVVTGGQPLSSLTTTALPPSDAARSTTNPYTTPSLDSRRKHESYLRGQVFSSEPSYNEPRGEFFNKQPSVRLTSQPIRRENFFEFGRKTGFVYEQQPETPGEKPSIGIAFFDFARNGVELIFVEDSLQMYTLPGDLGYHPHVRSLGANRFELFTCKDDFDESASNLFMTRTVYSLTPDDKGTYTFEVLSTDSYIKRHDIFMRGEIVERIGDHERVDHTRGNDFKPLDVNFIVENQNPYWHKPTTFDQFDVGQTIDNPLAVTAGIPREVAVPECMDPNSDTFEFEARDRAGDSVSWVRFDGNTMIVDPPEELAGSVVEIELIVQDPYHNPDGDYSFLQILPFYVDVKSEPIPYIQPIRNALVMARHSLILDLKHYIDVPKGSSLEELDITLGARLIGGLSAKASSSKAANVKFLGDAFYRIDPNEPEITCDLVVKDKAGYVATSYFEIKSQPISRVESLPELYLTVEATPTEINWTYELSKVTPIADNLIFNSMMAYQGIQAPPRLNSHGPDPEGGTVYMNPKLEDSGVYFLGFLGLDDDGEGMVLYSSELHLEVVEPSRSIMYDPTTASVFTVDPEVDVEGSINPDSEKSKKWLNTLFGKLFLISVFGGLGTVGFVILAICLLKKLDMQLTIPNPVPRHRRGEVEYVEMDDLA